MTKLRIALAGLCMLSMLGLLLLPHSAAARTTGNESNITGAPLAQVATATPDPSMMMEHATATPDAMMTGGTMEHPTATPDASMMAHPADTMMNSTLPTTGSSDNNGLIVLLGAALALLVSGFGIRKLVVSRK